MTHKGLVIWFSDLKGFGYIRPLQPIEGLEEGRDLFVHHSGISMRGYRTLKKAQFVEFETTHHLGKLVAIGVTPYNTAENGGAE